MEIGVLSCGARVFCDRFAREADDIVVCNRVKPHTSFRGPVESGLCKMMAVGMGKHAGATELPLARRSLARFLLPAIDVLVVGEIGKDISGAGMDPNVTGRLCKALHKGLLIF